MAVPQAIHSFDPLVTAPAAARRFAVATLRSWELDALAETVELLVSEVITNAVVHAETGGSMSMRWIDGVVRVEVTDGGRGAVVARHPGPNEVTGRGMALVESLARQWGVFVPDSSDHKTVWFEVDAQPST